MIGDDKDFLLSLLLPIRELLSDNCMTLHPNKIYIQPVSHGVNFLGSTIKTEEYILETEQSEILRILSDFSMSFLIRKDLLKVLPSVIIHMLAI